MWLSETGLCFRTARLESNHIFMLVVQHSVYLCLATMNMTNLLFLTFNWIGAFNSSTIVEKVCYVHWDVFITTVMFPMMKFLGVFSIFQFIHSFYILSISLHLISMCFCSSCDFLIKSKIKSYSIYFVTKEGLFTCP